MRRVISSIFLIIGVFAVIGCGAGTGTVTVNITDAPIDAAAVESVFITVTKLEYHVGDTEEWYEAAGFNGPQQYDLLSLTGGISEAMGEFLFPAGTITQLRFFLDAPETGSGTPSNPGCYVKLTGDDTKYPLFVPSAASSGYKATGSFEVPVNGTVSVTADFDVRKSVKKTGSTYNLQPTIRTIVDGEAGKIAGTVTYTGTDTLVVFAYEDGGYSSAQLSTDPPFSGAVSSAVLSNTAYILPYLAAGTYDLVFACFDSDGVYIDASVRTAEDVVVESGKTTTRDFTY